MDSLGPVSRKHQDWFDENDKEIQGLLEEKHQKHKAYLRNTSSVSSKTAYSNICKTVQTRLRDMQDSDWRPGGRGFNPRRGRQHSFVEIDHEIFSKVILSLPLIQEGQLSVSGERMCTILVNRLED